jgi:hypothetical protein
MLAITILLHCKFSESCTKGLSMQVSAFQRQLEQQQELHTALEKALVHDPGVLPNLIPSHLPAIVILISPYKTSSFDKCCDAISPLSQPHGCSSCSSSFLMKKSHEGFVYQL